MCSVGWSGDRSYLTTRQTPTPPPGDAGFSAGEPGEARKVTDMMFDIDEHLEMAYEDRFIADTDSTDTGDTDSFED